MSEWKSWLAAFVFSLPVFAAAQALPTQAIALEQQGKFADAVKVWREVIQQNPADAGAFARSRADWLARQLATLPNAEQPASGDRLSYRGQSLTIAHAAGPSSLGLFTERLLLM